MANPNRSSRRGNRKTRLLISPPIPRTSPQKRNGLAGASTMSFEVAQFACFGVSIDVFPGFSYSYSALAVLVLVLENTASSTSTSTISLSTSTIKAKKRNFKGQRRGSCYFSLMAYSASRLSTTAQKVFFHGCLDSSTSTSTSTSTTKSGAMHDPSDQAMRQV